MKDRPALSHPKPVRTPKKTGAEDATGLAIAGLTYLAGEPERLDRFLALSGLDHGSLRAAAGGPGFLAAGLDHIGSDEALILGLAAETGRDPANIAAARDMLSGSGGWTEPLSGEAGPIDPPGAVQKLVLCRDCLAELEPRSTPPRCRACGSPRLVMHPERRTLSIAHIDCDAFYAAVEKRDRPELRDKPVIIGGGVRGVVSTCCYVARTFGVRSAMPMFKALKACPDAVVVRPDMAKYAAVGREVRSLMRDLTPLVEPLSIDEAFLDLTGTSRLHGATPDRVLATFARRIETEIGITVSVGLSYCKFLAKIASDIDKPRGFAVIGRAEAISFLTGKPVGLIWGVGQVTQDKLAADGYRLIGDIQHAEESTLMRRYGSEGSRLWRLAHGLDTRIVSPERETKSVSSETTFDADISDPERLARTLYALSEKVSARLKDAELAGSTITLKLKTADFKSRTRARALNEPTQLATRIFDAARELLLKEATGAEFRLIGVGAGSLVDAANADHGDLADTRVVRDKATEKAMDALRGKFGTSAVVRGIAFDPRKTRKP